MKSITLALLTLFLLCQPGWAQSWQCKGATWTSKSGCVVTIPEGLKANLDKDGDLSAENDNALASLILMDEVLHKDQIMKILEETATKQFKGIKFGPAQSAAENGLEVTLKMATIKQDGESALITLGLFAKGPKKIAVMTVQKAGDKAADALLDKMMNSLHFK